MGLVFFMAIFLTWRIRYRFTHSERMGAEVCPRCGDRLQRIHRSWFDRLLSATLLPSARRYQCINKSCAWQGLRRRSQHHHHSPQIPEEWVTHHQ